MENQEIQEQQEQQEQSLEQLLSNSPALQEQYNAMLERSRQSWQQEAAEQQSEAEKLSKMSEAQRERYQFQKDKAAFEKQRSEFAASQLRLQMGSELQKRGFSPDMAQWITGKDADTSMANLEKFEAAFQAAVQAKLNNTMRSKVLPTEPRQKLPMDDFMKGFNG